MAALLVTAPATALADHARDLEPETVGPVSYTVVMLVGDETYHGVHVPTEVLAESVDTWEGLPVVPDHENAGKRRLEVGHVTDVRMEGDALVATLVLDPTTYAYDVVDDYIDDRFSRGETPEVSVGMDARTDREGHAKEIVGDHLAIVKRGACGPLDARVATQVAAGCGILPPGQDKGLAAGA